MPIETILEIEPQLANIRAYWLGWGTPRFLDHHVTLFQSGLGEPQLNGVLRVRAGLGTEQALTRAREQLAGLPWTWWVGQDSRPGLAKELRVLGARELTTTEVMSVHLDHLKESHKVPGLEVVEIKDPDALGQWVVVNGASFGFAPELNDDITRLEASRLDAPGTYVRFAGYIGGHMVGTASLLVSHGVAGIYVITTAEGYRRRGIGGSLTSAALRAGRARGMRIATLHASRLGAPLYRHLGFETVSSYHIFEPPQA